MFVHIHVLALVPKCSHEGDGNRKSVLVLCVHSYKHACAGIGLGVRAHKSVCVCLCAVYKHVFSKLKEKQSVISEES